MLRSKTKIHLIPVILLLLFVALGSYLLFHAMAATPFAAVEPENGTAAKGALNIADSQASGGKATRFAAPATTISGSVIKDSSSFSLKAGSFAALDKIRAQKFTKLNIGQIADAATTSMATCSVGTADSNIDWSIRSCLPFEETGWRQQGITGVGGSGWSTRNDIIITSWHNDDSTRARLDLLNLTTKKQIFVELVQPCTSAASGYCDLVSTTSQCSGVHAGGAVLYKKQLYIADSNCFITFNINEAYKVANGSYVLPSTGYWKRANTDITLSAIGLDTTGSKPQLLIAEYISGCTQTQFGDWNLDPSTGLLVPDKGSTTQVTINELFHVKGVCGAQGIDRRSGSWVLSTSGSGADYLYRYRYLSTAPANAKFETPPNTPEGIYSDPTTRTSWGLTENAASADDLTNRVFSYSTSKLYGM